MPEAPAFVRGIAVIRGVPTPVVELGVLLEQEQTRPTRLVLLKAGARRVALLVDEVVGLHTVDGSLDPLPPLLKVASAQAVAWIGVLDGELLAVLSAALLVPREVFTALDAQVAAAAT